MESSRINFFHFDLLLKRFYSLSLFFSCSSYQRHYKAAWKNNKELFDKIVKEAIQKGKEDVMVCAIVFVFEYVTVFLMQFSCYGRNPSWTCFF